MTDPSMHLFVMLNSSLRSVGSLKHLFRNDVSVIVSFSELKCILNVCLCLIYQDNKCHVLSCFRAIKVFSNILHFLTGWKSYFQDTGKSNTKEKIFFLC